MPSVRRSASEEGDMRKGVMGTVHVGRGWAAFRACFQVWILSPIQFISKQTLALDQLYDVVGKTCLTQWIKWIQDRAFLEIHPCWLESINAYPVSLKQCALTDGLAKVFPEKAPTVWHEGHLEVAEQHVASNMDVWSCSSGLPQVCVMQASVDIALKSLKLSWFSFWKACLRLAKS